MLKFTDRSCDARLTNEPQSVKTKSDDTNDTLWDAQIQGHPLWAMIL